MDTKEDTLTRPEIEGVLTAFENRDAEAASTCWAENGVFIDPHYPEPEYSGPDEIRAALEWALENIVEQPRLSVRMVWEDVDTFAIEADTRHRMQDGSEVDFPQVFIVETEDDQVTRWQSYLPFPPPADE